jgi:2-(1,2-epoxy-1,2-dihydrophenyl)acetyl-CoA isomerase
LSEFETILAEHRGDVLLLTLNRPDRLNAITLQMAAELETALSTSPAVRAIVITGAGRAFCAGVDLQMRSQQATHDGGEGTFLALSRHYHPLMLRLAELSIPVVAAVKGPAAGIGCMLALAADFVIAARSAYFLQAYVNIGLIPDGGASFTLTRLVGRARATEAMMLGEKISAEKAADWGMVYKLAEDSVLMDEAFALAKRLAEGPTAALGLIRRNIAAALDSTYAEALHREAIGQRTVRLTADADEGERAFLEKRKPAFKGT